MTMLASDAGSTNGSTSTASDTPNWVTPTWVATSGGLPPKGVSVACSPQLALQINVEKASRGEA